MVGVEAAEEVADVASLDSMADEVDQKNVGCD
jgi:hypothetical protein